MSSYQKRKLENIKLKERISELESLVNAGNLWRSELWNLMDEHNRRNRETAQFAIAMYRLSQDHGIAPDLSTFVSRLDSELLTDQLSTREMISVLQAKERELRAVFSTSAAPPLSIVR